MSSDCTQQHVSRQGLAENVNVCFVWARSWAVGALILHLFLSSLVTPKWFSFFTIKYFEPNWKAQSTYSIGATLLPLTSSVFSFKLCTSVSSRHSKFLSIFLLIIWFFQTLLLKFSEKLKRYRLQNVKKFNLLKIID